MIVNLGSRVASVEIDDATAAFASAGATEIVIAAVQGRADQRRALVELRQFHGGLAPHVIVGGVFEPGGNFLRLRIQHGAAAVGRRSCRSKLRRPKLQAGLPTELVEPALAGLSRTASLPPGVVIVDRAGYDPVETSPLITELAAELLGRALSMGALPSETQVVEWLGGLP